MFRIHEEQMAALGERSRRAFVARMADYLERAYAAEVGAKTRAELEGWIGAVVANAIFDAVGARVLQMPMTPARVKAALTTQTSSR